MPLFSSSSPIISEAFWKQVYDWSQCFMEKCFKSVWDKRATKEIIEVYKIINDMESVDKSLSLSNNTGLDGP